MSRVFWLVFWSIAAGLRAGKGPEWCLEGGGMAAALPNGDAAEAGEGRWGGEGMEPQTDADGAALTLARERRRAANR